MADHNSLGKIGEDLAEKYLIKNQFEILHRNWTFGHLEIDIIATKEGVLHFIEVKTRNSLAHGYPEQDVTKAKLRRVINAATEYQYQNPGWEKIQFDVLAITMIRGVAEYFFIEDIYV